MKLDRNGYSQNSILPTENCFICGKGGDLARHEVFPGRGNRAISKAEGLWTNLCPECHARVHQCGEDDEELKRTFYQAYIKKYSREKFYKLFYRYYD